MTEIIPPHAPLRIVIAGAVLGRAVFGDALAAMPGIEVAALCDSDIQLARAWMRTLHLKAPCYYTIAEMAATIEPPDALFISSSPEERASDIAAGKELGIPLLALAPFAGSLAEEVAAAGPPVTPALPRRHDPAFVEMAARLHALKARDLFIRCEYDLGRDDVGGGVPWRERLRATALPLADVCAWWLGEPAAVSADIEGDSAAAPSPALIRPDTRSGTANIIITHENGYATLQIRATSASTGQERWIVRARTESLELVAVAAGSRMELRERPPMAGPGSGQAVVLAAASTADRQQQMVEAFLAGLRGAGPAAPSDASVVATRILEAATRSSSTGARIMLQPIG